MKPDLPPTALRLAPALIVAVLTALGCSGAGIDSEAWEPEPQAMWDHAPDADSQASVSLGTPFVLEAVATQESLEGVRAELLRADGSRISAATGAISFELRSDGRFAAIDRVRVVLEPLASEEPVAISNRAPTVLTVLDSSPDYVRATAGQAWIMESLAEQRSGTGEVPVSVSLEAAADGTHVRLTMTLESRAEFHLGAMTVSTGPWVVQLEGELKPR